MTLSAKVTQMLKTKETQARKHDNFTKRPLEVEEMMDYPYFFKLKKNNLQLNTGKMAAMPLKRRTLSIMASTQTGSRGGLSEVKKAITPQSNNTFSNFYRSGPKMTIDPVPVMKPLDANMNDLMHNAYMNDYVVVRRDQDRENYLDNRLKNKKPIFKNYIDNNANIVRREVQIKKMREFKEKERMEEEIQHNLLQTADNFHHRTFDPDALVKNRPVRSVQRLMKNYHPTMSLNQESQLNEIDGTKMRKLSVVSPSELFKSKDRRPS